MILQLSCSDVNKKSWILFHAFSLLKTKALPPKFTFKFRLPICGQGNKEKFGGFGRITWFLFFSKEMDPHLGHWQNQKQRSKLLNFALKKKTTTKKKVLSKQIPLLQVSLFSSILIQTTGEHRYSWAAAQRWNPRIQPQIWMMASWNSRPQQQLQLPAQGLVKWNPRLQQRHLQSWYLEKHSLSPRKSLGLQEKPGAPEAPVASLEPNRNAAGGPRKQSLPTRGQLKLRTFKLFL